MRHLLFLSLLLLIACSSSNLTQSESTVNISELINKQWTVTSVDNKHLLHETTISFSVSDNGKVKGNAGVNHYFGLWEVKEKQISSSKMASTKKFGITPKGIMQQEEQFLSMLSTITQWHIERGELQLFDDNGTVIRLQLSQ